MTNGTVTTRRGVFSIVGGILAGAALTPTAAKADYETDDQPFILCNYDLFTKLDNQGSIFHGGTSPYHVLTTYRKIRILTHTSGWMSKDGEGLAFILGRNEWKRFCADTQFNWPDKPTWVTPLEGVFESYNYAGYQYVDVWSQGRLLGNTLVVNSNNAKDGPRPIESPAYLDKPRISACGTETGRFECRTVNFNTKEDDFLYIEKQIQQLQNELDVLKHDRKGKQ